jgi:hypothetical protein
MTDTWATMWAKVGQLDPRVSSSMGGVGNDSGRIVFNLEVAGPSDELVENRLLMN